MTPPAFPAREAGTRDPADDQVSTSAYACGAAVPDGGACNEIRDIGSAILPTCTTGEVPVGAGGNIVEGTYILVAETFYNVAQCPAGNLSGTLAIEGDCFQMVAHPSPGHEGSVEVRVTFKAHPQGTLLNGEVSCSSAGGRPAPAKTFTAEQSTLVFFTASANAAPGGNTPGRVEMFVRQGVPDPGR